MLILAHLSQQPLVFHVLLDLLEFIQPERVGLWALIEPTNASCEIPLFGDDAIKPFILSIIW